MVRMKNILLVDDSALIRRVLSDIIKSDKRFQVKDIARDGLEGLNLLLTNKGNYDAVICVGAVIRGDTSHYDLVCNESAKGIAQVELATGIPVLFGIITTENIEQAIARAGSKAGNKGYDCALSAIEMVNLLKQL